MVLIFKIWLLNIMQLRAANTKHIIFYSLSLLTFSSFYSIFLHLFSPTIAISAMQKSFLIFWSAFTFLLTRTHNSLFILALFKFVSA